MVLSKNIISSLDIFENNFSIYNKIKIIVENKTEELEKEFFLFIKNNI